MQGRGAFEGGEKIDMDEDVDADVGDDVDKDVDKNVGVSEDADVSEDVDVDENVAQDIAEDVVKDVFEDIDEDFDKDFDKDIDEDVDVDMDVDVDNLHKQAEHKPLLIPPLPSLSSPLKPSSASSSTMQFALPTLTSTSVSSTSELLSTPNPPRCARQGRPRLDRRRTSAAITLTKAVCPVLLRTPALLSSKSRGPLLRK